MRSLLLAALAVLLISAPVLAGQCPPRQPVLAASVVLCGDARAFIHVENSGNAAGTVEVRFTSPVTDERVVFERDVPAGADRTLVRWVKAHGERVAVRDADTGELLVRVRVDRRTVHPWRTCPVSR